MMYRKLVLPRFRKSVLITHSMYPFNTVYYGVYCIVCSSRVQQMCNKKSNMHGLSWQNIEAMFPHQNFNFLALRFEPWIRYLLLLNFCFVGIRLSDQIKDDVQKAGRIIIRFCSIVTSRVNNVTWHMFYQNIDFRNLGKIIFNLVTQTNTNICQVTLLTLEVTILQNLIIVLLTLIYFRKET
jgi:hypothetical protein